MRPTALWVIWILRCIASAYLCRFFDQSRKRTFHIFRQESYKQYLEKLHDTFGIPEIMPDPSQISAFIDEYELYRVWGITEKDVSKDLQSFIDGKYDEMRRDVTPFYKPVTRAVAKPRPIIPSRPVSPIIHHTTYSNYSNTYVPRSGAYTPPVTKREQPKNIESTKSKKPEKKKPVVKAKPEKEKTIFLDGDNHFDEGQKGIERLSKKTKVRAVFSQPGAKRKFDRKFGDRPNVSSKLVESGDQAVDNQIKSEAGQLLKKGNQDITFVSQDKDFVEFKDRKKNGRNGNRINVAKSVNEGQSKKKKK